MRRRNIDIKDAGDELRRLHHEFGRARKRLSDASKALEKSTWDAAYDMHHRCNPGRLRELRRFETAQMDAQRIAAKIRRITRAVDKAQQ